jgi:amino-acid N-acetyltransferase
LCRIEKAAFGVIPANERLDSQYFMRSQINLGLVIETEFPVLKGGTQVAFELNQLVAAGVKGIGFFTSGFSETGEELGVRLEHALRAVRAGVGRAHLVSRRADGAILLELFTHSGVGSMITADPVERLRTAKIEDVGGILALIEPLEADGSLVKRNRERLEHEIANFEVIEHDGAILACAALYPFAEDKSAELACLAVAPEYRDAGYGERLLHACEARAKELKIRRMFALTTRAQHWFIAQGFKEAGVDVLPEKRKALYNWKRNSKIFLKRL